MSNQEPKLDTCGCCEGVKPLTPAAVENSPGLSALAYRVGTHAQFKKTMQSALSKQPRLRELTTRDDDDPTIALTDAWATVLDVLSFYQERIANEGYLRTATERRSVLEMARSIGYELRPGVAADTCLAFTLDAAPGSPKSAKLGVGTKAQSVPGQDEAPQLFETIEQIEARAEWNKLRPKTTVDMPPGFGDTTLCLEGVSTKLEPGDALILVGDERMEDPGNENWDFRRVKRVKLVQPPPLTDPAAKPEPGYTIVTLDQALGSRRPHVEPPKRNPRVYALRQRAALFGHNAPDWRAMPDSVKAAFIGCAVADTNQIDQTDDWPGFAIAAIGTRRGLHAEYFADEELKTCVLERTDPKVEFAAGANFPGPEVKSRSFSVRWTGLLEPANSGLHTFYVSSNAGFRLFLNGRGVFSSWTNDFGKSKQASMQLTGGERYSLRLECHGTAGQTSIRLEWSGPQLPKAAIPESRLCPPDVYLDALYSQVVPSSWIALSRPTYSEIYQVADAVEDSRTDFTLTAKTTRLTIKGENLHLFDKNVRETVVFAESEELKIAKQPDYSSVEGDSVVLDKKAHGLLPGRLLAVTGIHSGTGEEVSEIVTLMHAGPAGELTELVFTKALENSYKRDTVAINANGARATHGETKMEVLGSGDGSKAFQKFTLKQKPLTYVSAATPAGTKSTLEIRVNDVLWEEAPSFYELSPEKRAYITRIADDGTVTVQFGDGINGARLPTGVENVSAKYRVGIGRDGMVDAKQISLLMTRPLGLKEVVNPLASSGAGSPQKLEKARLNAPLTVLTFDRIVSLQDYEDFVSAFPGIGKAQANLLWDGDQRLIHITVAGEDGSKIDESLDSYKNLVGAIDSARHPTHRVRVKPYEPLAFDLEAAVRVDRAYIVKDVLDAVKSALVAAFSFEKRSFGQPISRSEVMAVMHRVLGVIAGTLEKMHFTTQPASLKKRLPEDIAGWEVKPDKPARLLTLNPNGIKLTGIKT